MKNLLILLSLLALIGCGNKEGSTAPSDVTPPTTPESPTTPDDSERNIEMDNLTDLFEDDLNFYTVNNDTVFGFVFGGSNTTIKFQNTKINSKFSDLQNLGENVVGVCWYRSNGSRDIEYDRKWWDLLSDAQKKALVYHENGHCQLSREHRCSAVNEAGTLSIMYPSLQTDSYLLNPIPVTPSTYWTISTLNYLELELFTRNSQNIDDCNSLMHEKVNTNGDIAHFISIN